MLRAWTTLVAIALVACGAARPPEIRNAARSCRHVYEDKPGAYTVLVVDGRVAWIDDVLHQIHLSPVGGGDVTTFEVREVGDVHDAIVVGTDIVVTDAPGNAVRRISLVDRNATTMVEGIRHAYNLAFAGGVYVIAGEDNLYRFDPATKELTELHRGMADVLASRGPTVYAELDGRLLAIDARSQRETVLVASLSAVDGSPVHAAALAAVDGGVLWSTATGAIWFHDLATKQNRQLGQLATAALRIVPVGTDVYFAAGHRIQRLRGGRFEDIPLDTRGWHEPGALPIVAVGVYRDALVYHVPYAAFESTCLR